jgi:hypothetical protein
MGKPTKRPRLAAKASAAEQKAPPPSLQVTSKPSNLPTQPTKDEKRQARHDAFLKSISYYVQSNLEIQDKKATKRRKRPNKLKVNLSSLSTSLADIMAEDRIKKTRKMEVGVRPKGKQLRNEIERFKAVMEHPEFKANPLKAIREHVENTWERKEGMA